MASPERNAGPVAPGRGVQIDLAEQLINSQIKRSSRMAQTKAILRRHGFCHAVWLFDGRTARTVGYFDDTGFAHDCAAAINEELRGAP
jgi:hypothetical protein